MSVSLSKKNGVNNIHIVGLLRGLEKITHIKGLTHFWAEKKHSVYLSFILRYELWIWKEFRKSSWCGNLVSQENSPHQPLGSCIWVAFMRNPLCPSHLASSLLPTFCTLTNPFAGNLELFPLAQQALFIKEKWGLECSDTFSTESSLYFSGRS